jgi:hypothetical protein
MNGKNNVRKTDFPVEIDSIAISEILELSEQSLSTSTIQEMLSQDMSHDEVQAAAIVVALKWYLEERNVDSGFEVVIDQA